MVLVSTLDLDIPTIQAKVLLELIMMVLEQVGMLAVVNLLEHEVDRLDSHDEHVLNIAMPCYDTLSSAGSMMMQEMQAAIIFCHKPRTGH